MLYAVLTLLCNAVNKLMIWSVFKRRDIVIESGSRIIGKSLIKIGKNFYAGKGFWLHAVDCYNGQTFTPQIIIGNNVSLSDFCHIGATHYIKIGNNVLFGSKCYVTDHNHGIYSGDRVQSDPDIPPVQRKLTADSYVIIEDNVWIGDNVVILPGVRIGKGAIIGSNAVVTKDIPAYSIAVGIPARVVKKWDCIKKEWH